MYSSERSLDRACHGVSAMFSLVAAADFSGTSHSRSSKTLGTLYWRREERRVTSPSRVYFSCNRFLSPLPPSFAPAGPMYYLSLFPQLLASCSYGRNLSSLSAHRSFIVSSLSSESTIFSLLLLSGLSFSYRLVSFSSLVPRYSNDLGWWIWPSLSRAIGPLR